MSHTDSCDITSSSRITRSGIKHRIDGETAREADRRLLTLTNETTLDTTHFDTVRFPPPAWALEKFSAAAVDGSLAYSTYKGNDDVRDQVAESLSEFFDRDIRRDNVLLTPGTQAGLFTTLAGLVDSSTKVAIVDPDYLFSERILRFLDADITHIPLRDSGNEDGGLAPNLDELERAFNAGVEILLFSHPNNPTGAVYPRAVLERIAELAKRFGVTVIVDELYGRLVYGGTEFHHLASLPGMWERTITLVGPSKTESLSGYRLGIVVGAAAALEGAEDALSLTALRAPGYAQHVLTGWLVEDREFVAERIKQLEKLREMTIAAFEKLPWVNIRPQRGTAYLFPDVSALGLPDSAVSEALAVEANVLVSPGYQFGPSGQGSFRICYARDEEIWAEALESIITVLDNLYRKQQAA